MSFHPPQKIIKNMDIHFFVRLPSTITTTTQSRCLYQLIYLTRWCNANNGRVGAGPWQQWQHCDCRGEFGCAGEEDKERGAILKFKLIEQ